MRNSSSIKLGVPRLCLYCSCSWPYIFLPRCQTGLHASRPMWLKPSPTFTSRKHVMRNTKGERPERCMQAFPRHPSRRSRRHLRRLAVDESATKAETSKLKLPGQRTGCRPMGAPTCHSSEPHKLEPGESAAGVCWQRMSEVSCRDIRTCTHSKCLA